MNTRRQFLTGLGSLIITAPAIVHAANLMPVRVYEAPEIINITATEVMARWRDVINRLVNPPLLFDAQTGRTTPLVDHAANRMLEHLMKAEGWDGKPLNIAKPDYQAAGFMVL